MGRQSVRRWCVWLGTLALVVALPGRAAAQNIDFAAGYSYMHDSDAATSFPLGWFVSAGGPISQAFDLVGDISGNYKTVSLAPGVDAKMKVHTFMAGPRLVFAHTGQMTPWAQVLVGAANLSGSVFGISDSETDFAMQPGGGVDFDIQRSFKVRVGANVRIIKSAGNEFQFVTGVVFGR